VPAPPRIPNLLVAETVLAALGRVPSYADDLWARVHVLEGRCIRASGLHLVRAGEVFERLGLAEVARSEIEHHQAATGPPGSLYLRYHAVALFEHLGRVVAALAALVRDGLELEGVFGPDASLSHEGLIEQARAIDADLGAALERRRPGVLRIERLAEEAPRAGALRIASPDVAARTPPGGDDPGAVEVSELGVGPPEGPRREWLPIPELATAVVADAALLVEDVVRALVRRLDAGGRVELDVRIEV
jgi:hypothetical protein